MRDLDSIHVVRLMVLGVFIAIFVLDVAAMFWIGACYMLAAAAVLMTDVYRHPFASLLVFTPVFMTLCIWAMLETEYGIALGSFIFGLFVSYNTKEE